MPPNRCWEPSQQVPYIRAAVDPIEQSIKSAKINELDVDISDELLGDWSVGDYHWAISSSLSNFTDGNSNFKGGKHGAVFPASRMSSLSTTATIMGTNVNQGDRSSISSNYSLEVDINTRAGKEGEEDKQAGNSKISSPLLASELDGNKDNEIPVASTVLADRRSMFYKTQICPHERRGRCRLGLRCRFAHEEIELRPPPKLDKTRMCSSVREGVQCTLGSRCSFAHCRDELRYTVAFYKTNMCRNWATGQCLHPGTCNHAHGIQELLYFRKLAAERGNRDFSKEQTFGLLEETEKEYVEELLQETHRRRKKLSKRNNDVGRSGNVGISDSVQVLHSDKTEQPAFSWIKLRDFDETDRKLNIPGVRAVRERKEANTTLASKGARGRGKRSRRKEQRLNVGWYWENNMAHLYRSGEHEFCPTPTQRQLEGSPAQDWQALECLLCFPPYMIDAASERNFDSSILTRGEEPAEGVANKTVDTEVDLVARSMMKLFTKESKTTEGLHAESGCTEKCNESFLKGIHKSTVQSECMVPAQQVLNKLYNDAEAVQQFNNEIRGGKCIRQSFLEKETNSSEAEKNMHAMGMKYNDSRSQSMAVIESMMESLGFVNTDVRLKNACS